MATGKTPSSSIHTAAVSHERHTSSGYGSRVEEGACFQVSASHRRAGPLAARKSGDAAAG
jgi:hypothetical protein